jgi:hypothetical protein
MLDNADNTKAKLLIMRGAALMPLVHSGARALHGRLIAII